MQSHARRQDLETALTSGIPDPLTSDAEDVRWALSTSAALWATGAREDSVRWLRRAAEHAIDAGDDARAIALFKIAAEIGSAPRPRATRPSGIGLRARAGDTRTMVGIGTEDPFPLLKRALSAPREDDVGIDVLLEEPAPELELPSWVPENRVMGGYYLERALGSGAAGTVFVVTRANESNGERAERFALKVPEYAALLEQGLSETEALRMLRDEASALLSLPEHPNLARFVTFDTAAKPRPFLVMELVEGIGCDNLIASGELTLERAFALLDGVLAGLETMHAGNVGHLDLKPSNVVVRNGQQAVLVDFGLSGRRLRPFFSTCEYGAPEIWGESELTAVATPATADVYSFGCLAYEVLTGRVLFDAPSAISVMALHHAHDGVPPPVHFLAACGLVELAEFLRSCLRHDPRDRKSVAELRVALRELSIALADRNWPL